MLRFDVPQVWSNVIRWEAFMTFVLSLIALLLAPWVMLLLVAQGFVRGFIGHHRCPSHLLWKKNCRIPAMGRQKGKCRRQDVRQQDTVPRRHGVDGAVFLWQRSVDRALCGTDRVFLPGVGAVLLRGVLGVRLVVSAFPAEDAIRAQGLDKSSPYAEGALTPLRPARL